MWPNAQPARTMAKGSCIFKKPMDFEGVTSEPRWGPETSCKQPFAAVKGRDLILPRRRLGHRIVAVDRSAAGDLEGGQPSSNAGTKTWKSRPCRDVFQKGSTHRLSRAPSFTGQQGRFSITRGDQSISRHMPRFTCGGPTRTICSPRLSAGWAQRTPVGRKRKPMSRQGVVSPSWKRRSSG